MNPNADTYPAVVESTPLAAPLLPLTNKRSRRTKSTLPTRPASLFSYDALGRLFLQQEPWAGGGFKITRISYLTDSRMENSSRIVSEFILDQSNTEYFLKKNQYEYTETPILKQEIITSTATGSDITRKSLREWFGNDCPPLIRGKLKRSIDYNGIEYHYEYADVSGKRFPKPFAGKPSCTRISTLLVQGKIVPGQSSRSTEIYDTRACCLCRQNHVHDGAAFIPTHVEFHHYDEKGQLLRSYRGKHLESETGWEDGLITQVTQKGKKISFKYDSQKRLIETCVTLAPPADKVSFSFAPKITRRKYDRAGKLRQLITRQGELQNEELFSYARASAKASPVRARLCSRLPNVEATEQPSRFHRQRATSSGIMTEARLHAPNGPLYEEHLLNGFGEIILQRKAVAPGVMEETSFCYNEKGQLIQESTVGKPPLHFRYDSLGHLSEKYILVDTITGAIEFILESYQHSYCQNNALAKVPARKYLLAPPVLYYKTTHSRHSAGGSTTTESSLHKISTLYMEPGESFFIHRDKYGHCSVTDTCLNSSRGELITYSYIPDSPDSAYEIHRDNHLVGGKHRNGSVFDISTAGSSIYKQKRTEQDQKNVAGIKYDNKRHPICLTSPTGGEIRFEYEEVSGAPISLTCHGKTTLFHYNKYGRIARITYPDKSSKEYHYADFHSEILTAITFSGHSTPIRFHYDAAHQITQIEDSTGTRHFHYSPFLDLETEESALCHTRLTYIRDLWGRPSGHTLFQKEALLQKCEMKYDRCGRICRLDIAPRSFFLFTYHPETGAPSGILFPNGIRQQSVFLRLSDNIAMLKYRFPHHLRTLEYTSTPDHGANNSDPLLPVNSFPKKFIHDPLPEKMTTFTGIWQIQHDARQLPTHFRQGDLLIEFLYDYRGRRSEKKIYESGRLVERICYTYSDTRLLCEFDHTSGIPIPMCSYLWHPLIAVPLAFILCKGDLKEICYYLLDPDHNVRALVDNSCRLRATYRYDLKDGVTEQTGDLADLNPFRRGALYHDEELGFPLPLYFSRADEEKRSPLD